MNAEETFSTSIISIYVPFNSGEPKVRKYSCHQFNHPPFIIIIIIVMVLIIAKAQGREAFGTDCVLMLHVSPLTGPPWLIKRYWQKIFFNSTLN